MGDEIGDYSGLTVLNISYIPPVTKLHAGEESQRFFTHLQHHHSHQQCRHQHVCLISDPKCNGGSAKELSKTVAESMGLYMNSVKEMGNEFNYGLHSEQMDGRPGNNSESDGQEISLQSEEKMNSILLKQGKRRCSSSSSPGRSSLGSCMSSPTSFNNLGSAMSSPNNMGSCVSSPSKINCLALSSPDTVSNLGSSIASPDNINNLSTSVASPSAVRCSISSPSKINNLTMTSPSNMNSLGSSISNPANVNNLRSSVSSPNNLSSPTSIPTNLASPSSAPVDNNMLGSSLYSPSNNNRVGSSAYRPVLNNLHFPPLNPSNGLRLVLDSPQNTGARSQSNREMNVFKEEKPKVEGLETGMLNNMNPVQFIKTEVDSDFSESCFLSRGSSELTDSTFSLPIKCEMNEDACLNMMYDSQVSENPFSEIAHLTNDGKMSYGDTFDICGILGAAASSSTSSYEHDVFLQPILTPVIKQEPNDESYCQGSCSSPSTVVGVNSTGQSFHYRIGAGGTISLPRPYMKDQRQQFVNLIPPVCTLLGSWKSRPIMTQISTPPGRSDGYPVQGYIPENMSRSSIISSSVTSGPSKVCLVCSDEASGCHYGVLTCGSCKVFFKRAVEGQQNYLCAGRNDCIIDKIRRKNCPACRLRKCLKAGMNLGARKSKKLGKVKGVHEDQQPPHSPKEGITFTAPLPEPTASTAAIPHYSLLPMHINHSVTTVLQVIEPEVVYACYDSSVPDNTTHLLSSLNRLAEKQMIRIVKWAKVLPGFRNLALDDQMVLLRYSWMSLMSFGLSWRSFKHTNGTMLYFAPDLIFDEQRMQKSAMYELCQGMQRIGLEFVRLQLTYEEFLCMKSILLLGTIPKDGLNSLANFEEMRANYIKELRRIIARNENNSGQNWQRFYQLTKILDCMHELAGGLLQFCFYTFMESKALNIEFPDMLVEIINDQLPEVTTGMTKSLYFHKK
ncbi:mineralocorticoid receptor [Callorhinchus milii]|uniref:Nuclear receptor subfamily 3 group C member 2 n=1 Tax=Callorhinchus milii TaxID=7868 RepID=A0A4W3I5J5_CALMI|nr:mineralocorticoid receptor [Callorhinchus milii]|eukprot:gi/632971539/ref/XP_007902220.1/ PREDICTED: mineralocorticoid receptor [Callorhinchus milii]